MGTQGRNRIGVAAVVVAVIVLLVDNLLARAVDERADWVRFLVFSLLCAAVAAAIWLYLIPAAERASDDQDRLAQAGFGAGLLALATLVVFPTALPIVLGAGAVVMGRAGEDRSVRSAEGSEEEQRRRDETQSPEPGEREDVSPGQRASQGWAGTVMGAMAVVACLILFVVAGSG